MEDLLKTWGPLLAVAIGFLLALLREIVIFCHRRKRANGAVNEIFRELKEIVRKDPPAKTLFDFKDRDLRAKSAAAFGEKMSDYIYLNASATRLSEFEKSIRLVYHYRDMSDKYLGQDIAKPLDTQARQEYFDLVNVVFNRTIKLMSGVSVYDVDPTWKDLRP